MRRRLSVVLFTLGLLLSAASAAGQTGAREVFVGEIRGIINPVMAGYVTRVIDEAERSNAAAVVFTMDTPGGLSESMREINQRILAARVPVVVYVSPGGARAGSAGVYIAYAAHVSAMAPATNIGSATPVSMGEQGEERMSEEMRGKVTNDAVAQIRALAEQRGRNAEFAERAVREATNLQASEAHRENVVDFLAGDLGDLLRQIDGRRVRLASSEVTLQVSGAAIRSTEMTALENLLLAITNPTLAYLLLSLGSLGLMVEMYNPGSIFPGVLGAISLLLALYALGTLPVNYAALALLGFGLLLFALEPFVVSHGVLGAGGALAFAIGSLLLINTSNAPYLQIEPGAIAAMTGLMLLFVFVLVGSILQLRRRKVVTGREGVLGDEGVVLEAIGPAREGLVRLRGERWRAVSDVEVGEGDRVVVRSVNGLVLSVSPVRVGSSTSSASSPA